MRFGTKAAAAGPVASRWTFTQGVWTQVFAVPTVNTFTQGMAIDPLDPSRVYVCMVNLVDTNDVGVGIWRVTPAGATRLCGPSHPVNTSPTTCINLIFPDPTRSDLMLAASGVAGGFGIYRTANWGANWATSGDFLSVTPTTDCYKIVADPTDPRHLLLSFHQAWGGRNAPGILRSTNQGANWTVIEPPTGAVTTGGTNIDFLYHPGFGIGSATRWLYQTQDDGKYLTNNSGSSWTQCSTLTMDHGGAQIVYASNGDIYTTGGTRVARSTDVGASWSDVGPSDNNNWLALASDGTKIFTQQHNGGAVRQATMPATASGDWSNLGAATFPSSGSFQLHYDPVYGRLWNAGLGNGLYVYQF